VYSARSPRRCRSKVTRSGSWSRWRPGEEHSERVPGERQGQKRRTEVLVRLVRQLVHIVLNEPKPILLGDRGRRLLRRFRTFFLDRQLSDRLDEIP